MSDLGERDTIAVFLLPIESWDACQIPADEIDDLFHESERLRFQRILHQDKKNEFIASRLLLRFLLTRYTSYDATCIETIPDRLGRPFWFFNGQPIDYYFSLSHTKKMVCCSLGRYPETGCDIERITGRKNQQALAKKIMNSEEYQRYLRLSSAEQLEFFFRTWSLKEAYVKALGTGVRFSLSALNLANRAMQNGIFSVSSQQLGTSCCGRSFAFFSAVVNDQYSLGIATSLAEARISFCCLQLEGSNISETALESNSYLR